MIAAHHSMIGTGKWKNPYITDGLVAMWDGEWNAGGGIHDPNATTWRDLAGILDLTFAKAPVWFGNSLQITMANTYCAANDTVQTLSDCTIEWCGEIFDYNLTNRDLFSFDQIAGSGIVSYANTSNYSENVWWILGSARSDMPIVGFDTANPCSSTLTYNGTSFFAYRNSAYMSNYTNPNKGIRGFVSLGALRKTDNRQIRSQRVHRFAIYSRALTAEEVAANSAVDKARFNLP